MTNHTGRDQDERLTGRLSDGSGFEALGIIQRTNLCLLEDALRDQWRLGQNILLCWCPRPTGVDLLVVPHYYLGQFSASLGDASPDDRLDLLNGRFLRQLISGRRQMRPDEFAGTARRLELTPTSVELPISLLEDPLALEAAEQLIKRFSISHVPHRSVLLFDIADFSLFSPFEQASQLNSLSYSLNSAYSKLRKRNIDVQFARTTTGDGFYIWHREISPRANLELFQFMLVVIADNAIARRKAHNRTVPALRTAFHTGSHYEFSQVDGVNPTLYSYIVGDVTIELARMVELARPGQIFVGEFATRVPTSAREGAFLIDVDSQRFVERVGKHLEQLRGLELSGEQIEFMHCFLTGETGPSAGHSARRYRIVDKHGRSRHAFNLRINIHTGGRPLIMGMQEGRSHTERWRSGRREAAAVRPRSRVNEGGREI